MNHLLNKYMHHYVELHELKRQSVQNWLPFVLISILTICCSSDKGFKTENENSLNPNPSDMHADLSSRYTTAIIKKAGFLVSEAK